MEFNKTNHLMKLLLLEFGGFAPNYNQTMALEYVRKVRNQFGETYYGVEWKRMNKFVITYGDH